MRKKKTKKEEEERRRKKKKEEERRGKKKKEEEWNRDHYQMQSVDIKDSPFDIQRKRKKESQCNISFSLLN